MDGKIEHLAMIQQVINRMASNSFVLKGWSVTITSALFALAAKDAERNFVLLAIFPMLMFWALDGYFLWKERLFRQLYDRVRRDECKDPFSMDASSKSDREWLANIFSGTLIIFHGLIGGGIIGAWFIIGR